MSSKRSKAARARAAAAAKRARTEESELVAPAEFERPPPATDVISTLPLELLALIFARAPFRARLRAIGLVSRRFRTAALRSVDTLALVRGDIVAPAVLPAALALFPALTDLALSTHCPLLALPSSLQRLSLRGGLEVLMRTEEAGVRTVLSATFPALTALSLSTCHGVRAHSRRLPQNPLVAFVARHAPRLRALTLQCTLFALAAQVVAAPFPALEELDLSAELRTPRLEALLRSAPRLRETALRQSDELLALPPALLTSLTRLEPGAYVSPELGALLRRLPSLRHVGADAETLAAFGLRAFAYHVHLAHEPFRALEHCSNVVDLTISPMCRGPFVPPRLPTCASSRWATSGCPATAGSRPPRSACSLHSSARARRCAM